MNSKLDQLIEHVETHYSEGTWEQFAAKRNLQQQKPESLERDFEEQLFRRTRLFCEYIEETFYQHVLPRLETSYNPKVLSLPCANGEEVCSIAILAQEAGVSNCIVQGRDISEQNIEHAIKGETWIKKERKKDFQHHIDAGYFVSTNAKFPDPNLFVTKGIKRKCEYFVHDILKSPVQENFDAIYCLNLLPRFNLYGCKTAVDNLTRNMQPGNLLILDASYWVPDGKLFCSDKANYSWKKEQNNFL